MAVSIDTVYQRVLALANKEQRGYITPQEFNLFANQAQNEIFEQYFYDLNQFGRVHGNDTQYSDMLTLLNEKIEIFETRETISLVSPLGDEYGIYDLTSIGNLYRVGTITYGDSSVSPRPIILEKVSEKEFHLMQQSPLTKPVAIRPVYFISNIYTIAANLTASIQSSNISVYYVRKPKKIQWGYFVINDKALYDSNPSKTTDFELHASEESELVYRILAFAGIKLQKPELLQAATVLEGTKVQQEKQ